EDALPRAEDGGGLGHEMDAAEDDQVGAGGGRLSRQAQRVADEIRDVLHLGHLVVVGEDDRVALASELANLGAHAGDVARHCPRAVVRAVRRQVQNLYRHVLTTSRLKSRAGAEWVSAPTEIRSTPACAAAIAPSSVMPPD